MPLKFQWPGRAVSNNRWAYFGSFWYDHEINDLPPAVRKMLSEDDIARLGSIPYGEDLYVAAGDGGAVVSDGAPEVAANGLRPAAVLDTAEEINLHASRIETGVDSENRRYVEVDGRRTRQDPVDGDHIVMLEWNVPDNSADSAFMF